MKKSITTSVTTIVALLALAISQIGISEEKTVKDGVFTAAQAAAGKLVYEDSCKGCHDLRFYRGILSAYSDQPVLWLWESILGTMPADNPGSLTLDNYTDVIAFVLSDNGFPAGDTKLDPDNGMDAIRIVKP